MEKLTIKMNLEQAKDVYEALNNSESMYGFADDLVCIVEKYIEKNQPITKGKIVLTDMAQEAQVIVSRALTGLFNEIKESNPSPDDMFSAAMYLNELLHCKKYSHKEYTKIDEACDFCGISALVTLDKIDPEFHKLLAK